MIKKTCVAAVMTLAVFVSPNGLIHAGCLDAANQIWVGERICLIVTQVSGNSRDFKVYQRNKHNGWDDPITYRDFVVIDGTSEEKCCRLEGKSIAPGGLNINLNGTSQSWVR